MFDYLKIKLYLINTIIFVSILFSGPYNSGLIQWTQPNGVSFTARLWGDEFIWWFVTDGGYQIIESEDYYYYYAVLDEDGDYTASNNRVGIDSPPVESFQLNRSPERIAQIDSTVQVFNQQLIQNHIWYKSKKQLRETNLKIGTILVDFTPLQRNPYCFLDSTEILYDSTYKKAHFDSLLFSTGYWYNPDLELERSPDGERVYGSFRDFFKKQTLGEWDKIND